MTSNFRQITATAAMLGLVSGALTTLAWMVPGQLASDSGSSFGSLLEHIAPGILFGVILGVWIARQRSMGLHRVAGFMVLVELAWLCAYYFARSTADHWDGVLSAVAEIGLAAGFIGGLGVAVSTALVFRLPIWPGPAIAMVTAGAVAGAILPVEFNPEILTPLFYVWQTAVAAAIGWAVGVARTT